MQDTLQYLLHDPTYRGFAIITLAFIAIFLQGPSYLTAPCKMTRSDSPLCRPVFLASVDFTTSTLAILIGALLVYLTAPLPFMFRPTTAPPPVEVVLTADGKLGATPLPNPIDASDPYRWVLLADFGPLSPGCYRLALTPSLGLRVGDHFLLPQRVEPEDKLPEALKPYRETPSPKLCIDRDRPAARALLKHPKQPSLETPTVSLLGWAILAFSAFLTATGALAFVSSSSLPLAAALLGGPAGLAGLFLVLFAHPLPTPAPTEVVLESRGRLLLKPPFSDDPVALKLPTLAPACYRLTLHPNPTHLSLVRTDDGTFFIPTPKEKNPLFSDPELAVPLPQLHGTPLERYPTLCLTPEQPVARAEIPPPSPNSE